MKRISTIALVFVLTVCLMAGCRSNNMSGTGSTDGSTGNTTITPSTDDTRVPESNTRNRDWNTGTDPMDGMFGGNDAMPRSPIPGVG